MDAKVIFDVSDHFLGRVRLIDTDDCWSLHVGRRDISVNKKTGEIDGSGTYVGDPLPPNMRPKTT